MKRKKLSKEELDALVPHKPLMAPSLRTIKCPKCGAHKKIASGEKPVCDNCGFS